MRAREAVHEVEVRVGDRLEQRCGQPLRKRHTQGVAKARGVLDGDEPLLARDHHLDHPSCRDELGQPPFTAS